MGNWDRLKRAVRSNLERLRADPFTRDLGSLDRASLRPVIDSSRGQAKELERDLRELEAEEEALGKAIRAALKEGRRSQGLDLAQKLSEVRQSKAQVESHLVEVRRTLAKADRLISGGGSQRDEAEVRAEATLDRLTRELAQDGQLAGSSAPDAGPVQKSLGAASGSAADAEVETPVHKTLGGAAPPAADTAPSGSPVSKTLGEADAASAPPATDLDDLIPQLERLADLKQRGLLSEDEFAQAKRKLLG